MRQKLKRCAAFLLVFLLTMSGMATDLVSAATARATTMKLDSYTGKVTVQTMNGKSRKASRGMRLLNGYEVGTGVASNAFINLDDVKAVKLDEKSQVQVRQSGKSLELMTQSGNIFFNVSKSLADDESFKVRSSTLVTGVRGTSAYITVDEESTSVYLLEGTLELTRTNPETGKVENVVINGGEVAISYKYASKKVNVMVEKFTESDVPYFVLEEVAKDEALQKKIDELSILSSENLLQMKNYLDEGMTQEEAQKKLEEETNKPEETKPEEPETDDSTSENTKPQEPAVSGGGWSGGSTYVPSVSPNVPPQEKPDTPDEIINYVNDARFADGYPKYQRDVDTNIVTLTYRIADSLEVSETNPMELFVLSSINNMGANTDSQAVMNGFQVLQTSIDKQEPYYNEGNSQCNYTKITDHEEVVITVSKLAEYEDSFNSWAVLKDSSGVVSEVPTLISVNSSSHYITDPHITSANLSSDRTKVYAYVWTMGMSGLNLNKVPDPSCFTVGNYSSDTLMTATGITIDNVNDNRFYYSSRICLTFDQPIPEITEQKLRLTYSEPTENQIQDTQGNLLSQELSSTEIKTEGLTMENVYCSEENGEYYLRCILKNKVWNPDEDLIVQINDTISVGFNEENFYYRCDGWNSSEILIRNLSESPQSVSIKTKSGKLVYDYAQDGYSSLESQEVVYSDKLEISSAVYNEKLHALVLRFKGLVCEQQILGYNFAVKKEGQVLDYAIRGAKQLPVVSGNTMEFVLGEEYLKAADWNRDDIKGGKYTISCVNKVGWGESYAVSNDAGMLCTSQNIPIILDSNDYTMEIQSYTTANGVGSTADNPFVVYGTLSGNLSVLVRLGESIVDSGNSDLSISWSLEKIAGDLEYSASVKPTYWNNALVTVGGYGNNVYKITAKVGELSAHYYITFQETYVTN